MIRPYQVVVWGATGFTGRLVCEHLATHYQGQVRWAIAGRNSQKLEQVREELTKINPACKAVPIMLADLTNKASLKDMVATTDVVVSTVGPFSLYGTLLVEASVEQGTHYCDITGEAPWVKQMYKRYNEEAEKKQIRIVHCCGFDSVPSDLGTYLVADHVKNTLGKQCAGVDAIVHSEEVNGTVSGGSIESIVTMSKVFGPTELAKLASDPYYLVPENAKKGSDTVTGLLPSYNAATGYSCGVSIMESINSRVVHLSNALRKEPYGSDFKFHEYLGFKGWLMGRIQAAFASCLLLLAGGLLVSPIGGMLRRLLPKVGEGPSRERMLKGYWAQTMVATTQEPAGQKPQVATALIAHKHGDWGYYSTSRMLLECALCLALQKEDLDVVGDTKKGGVITPAVAFGMVLVNRLRQAGYVMEVENGKGVKAIGVVEGEIVGPLSS